MSRRHLEHVYWLGGGSRRNLVERARLFTDRLRAETRRPGLPAIEVDTAVGDDALAAAVLDAFGL